MLYFKKFMTAEIISHNNSKIRSALEGCESKNVYEINIDVSGIPPIIQDDETVVLIPCNKPIEDFTPGEVVFARPRSGNKVSRGKGSYGFYMVHQLYTRNTPVDKSRAYPKILLIGNSETVLGRTQNPLGVVTHVVSNDGAKETIRNRLERLRWKPGSSMGYFNLALSKK